MRPRSKLTVSYLGQGFHGWQRQPQQRTVQGDLERALGDLTGVSEIAVVGAGRTDAGVHAAGQVAHVDLPTDIPPAGLHRALNHRLPEDVRVRLVRRTHDAFHARRDAVAKHYCFRTTWRPSTVPWRGLRRAEIPQISESDALHNALMSLEGTHDMASFTVPGIAAQSTIRTLYRAWLRPRVDGIDFHFVGNGFLRYQVRRMVGAIFAIGRGELSVAEFEGFLRSPTPGAPILTAPARGLTLERVYYRSVASLGF